MMFDSETLTNEERYFVLAVFQEMSNRGINRIPYKDEWYNDAIISVSERFKKEGGLPEPLNTLLLRRPLFGDFSRLNLCLKGEIIGPRRIYTMPHRPDELRIDLRPKELDDRGGEVDISLVRKVVDYFVEGLGYE
ncbi:MAG: hypothetical protein ABIB79_04750 [archaeon]